MFALRLSFVLIAGIICGIVGMVIGAYLGGNYFIDFTFNGVRGYEATSQLGFLIGSIGGGFLCWLILLTDLEFQLKSKWIQKHALLTFFLLAYAFSWMVEIPLALSAQGVITARIPFALHYLAGYGPMLAALIVTGLTDGRDGLRDLWARMTKWKLSLRWWLVAVSPLGIYLLAGAALWLIQGQKMDLVAMGQIDYLPPLGLAAVPLWILTFGIGEETGWRGFALLRLQNGCSALSATLLLWVFWALWHLPLFFYSYDPSIIPGMLIGLLAGAITFTWLYNSTGGSVLMTAIWHGLFNYTTACTDCKTGPTAVVISTVVMIWAVVVISWCQPADLVHPRKKIRFRRSNL